MEHFLKTCLVVLVLCGNPAFAQVPVFREPQANLIEYYPDIVWNRQNTGTRSYTTPPLHGLSHYTLPANTQGHNPSMFMIEQLGSSANVQRMHADEDIRRHEMQQRQQQEAIREAYAALHELTIEYELPFRELPEKRRYAVAFNEITKMLNGETPLNLERAVFLSESAFDPALKFTDFDSQLNKAAAVIGLKMQSDNISPTDNLGKIMATFRFMADTLTVSNKIEGRITTYPKTYDFEDLWGRQNYRKMFVSKLLKEGNGQCHSLPLLFLLLCEKTGAEAHLAFAPNHSFVKFQDKRGQWHNIELTNGMLATDHFMIESGYIKAEAMQSKIYLEPLTKKQVVVQCLNDLALGYQKKYGYDPFVKLCSETALEYEPKSLTARQIRSNYYVALSNYILYQYKMKGFSKAHIEQDKQAQAVFTATTEAIQFIDDLGYSDMPEEAYQAWLNSIQKETCKQQHSNEIKALGGMIEFKK